MAALVSAHPPTAVVYWQRGSDTMQSVRGIMHSFLNLLMFDKHTKWQAQAQEGEDVHFSERVKEVHSYADGEE